MNNTLPPTLVVNALGQNITPAHNLSVGCPETLSALGHAIGRNAARLTQHCGLGTLNSVELHSSEGVMMRLEPSAKGQLLIHC